MNTQPNAEQNTASSSSTLRQRLDAIVLPELDLIYRVGKNGGEEYSIDFMSRLARFVEDQQDSREDTTRHLTIMEIRNELEKLEHLAGEGHRVLLQVLDILSRLDK
jgi:hypothetical protein